MRLLKKLFLAFNVGVLGMSGVTGLSSVQSKTDDSLNLCPDPTFSNGKLWNKPAQGCSIAHGEGLNGNTALLVQRSNAKSYSLLTRKINGLKPNTAYNFGVWVKGKGINVNMKGMDKRGGTVCIEFHYKGKYMSGGSYPSGVYGTSDWKLIEGKVTTPAKFDRAAICFYLGKYTTGKAWFYSPYIRKDAPCWKVGLLCPVMNFAINPGRQDLIFSAFLYGFKYNGNNVSIEIVRNGETEQSLTGVIRDNRIKTSVRLLPGRYTIKLSLKDKKFNLKKEIPIQVLDPSIAPKNKVFVDNRGRTWVNGKKFLPVGVYTNQQSSGFKKWNNKWREEDTKNLKKSPFNCIMPYDAMKWRLKGSKLTGIAAHREVLDELHKNDIKVIFSVKDIRHKWDKWYGAKGADAVTKKVVKTFRNHPGLLAWYTNDEDEVEQLDLDKRKLIGELDPYHPTWQVQCIYYRFNSHQGASDLFGVDPYPVKDGARDMKLVKKNMDLAMQAVGFNGKIALWAVPQIFPWSQHRGFEKECWPNETQIRSMSLLMAVMGAKGFVMFAYPSLFRNGDVDFKKYWPGVCNAAQSLQDVGPYLLGDPQAPPLEVKTLKGDVKAKAFTADNGKTCVIITAIGPGPAKAEIRLDGDAQLKSKYGRSTLSNDGSWIFKGKDVDSDVLVPLQ